MRPDTASDGACCGTEGVHILGIFPLHGAREFARLSCVAVTETVTPCREAVCLTRERLLTLLLQILTHKRVEAIFDDLEKKVDVQLTINDAEARAIGFLAKIM